ncbi:60s ribosomal protein l7 [Amanita muscaria]
MCPSVVPTVERSVVRFGRAPRITKHLRRNRRTNLPQPHVNVVTRDFAPSRLEDHYYTTLRDDLMYMTYKHENPETRKKPREIRLKFDPDDPYTKNRKNPPVGGSQLGRKPAPLVTPENVLRLETISIHTMVKEAISNKSNILGAIMALRALTGETHKGGGRHAVEGIQIVKGKKSVGGWIRPGVPVGVKVDLKVNSPSAVSGVVSFGLPPSAMGLFPQVEVNLDAYPKSYGMHIHFVTNATGLGAQNRARTLVSGFQIPFLRR